jgi:hypothetical protein
MRSRKQVSDLRYRHRQVLLAKDLDHDDLEAIMKAEPSERSKTLDAKIS